MFVTEYFVFFHIVASVLLSMVAFLTIFLLVKILQQPIRIFEISGYWSCHGEKNACYPIWTKVGMKGNMCVADKMALVLGSRAQHT